MTSVILNQEAPTAPSTTYSYNSRPRVVPDRKRYRKSKIDNEREEGSVRYGNLMYDRRVVRGNTYAIPMPPWSPEPDPAEIQRRREAYRKMLARRRAKEESEIHAPEVDDSGKKVVVQTELYLEEIAERIIEMDTECQTDAFLARSASPLFIPEKTGADVSTQIEEGELFDFDIEVKPVLEVLVGKTIEQALIEVIEEEELATLHAHQYYYHELRNAEIAELHRLEEQEKRRKEEKKRRMQQRLDEQEKESKVSERIAARAFAQQYLRNLIPSVLTSLQNKGFFYNDIQKEIEEDFLPYLMQNVEQRIDKRLLGRIMTDCLINEVVGNRFYSFARTRLHGQQSQKGKTSRQKQYSGSNRYGRRGVSDDR
ncbi:radial spoke head protein 3 homolog [Sceloporus undulatus]|uniref:radial spoke head protein 3 homolog n=1 Tax=Sceloporus undulatus TaxID=8520 RepID=UPI001C4AF967|nr:radial spoke head protein 3 homolog [Sceloporus undulatus]